MRARMRQGRSAERSEERGVVVESHDVRRKQIWGALAGFLGLFKRT